MLRDRTPRRPSWRAALAAVLALAAGHAAADADPLEWLPVESPLYEELDLLHAEGLIDTAVTWDARPLARWEVARLVAHVVTRRPALREHPGVIRLARAFSRELVRVGFEPAPGYTPPLISWTDGGDAPGADRDRLRVIPYLDGAVERRFDGRGRLADRSRAGVRIGVEIGDLFLYQDLFAGRIPGARRFADALIEDTDFIHFTEDTYASLRTRWLDLSLGRSRYAWGPGRDGSLLWSAEAAPVTNLRWGRSLFGGRVRGTAVHADVNAARDARLAAHRVEVAVTPSLVVGLAEAARYSSPQWEPLYLVSVVPFTVVQRMLDQDALDDPGRSTRNNVIAALDARWRVLDGTVLYGEFLLDDLSFEKSGTPTRVGYQAGWLGVGRFLERRLAWRGEISRVHRFVYSVFYDENFVHHGAPIGFPLGPDSRGVVVRALYDWNAAWRVELAAVQAERGEGALGESFDPGGPPASGSAFKGVVEETRLVEAAVRWLPRDGVEARAAWRYRWRENAAHADGVDDEDWSGGLALVLRR